MLGRLIGWTGLLLALVSPFAAAQQYPTKVITILVPAAAGGPTDTVARVLAPPMAKDLKGQVIVENAGGAGGTIGAGRVARLPGDGYTLYLVSHCAFDVPGALPQARFRSGQGL